METEKGCQMHTWTLDNITMLRKHIPDTGIRKAESHFFNIRIINMQNLTYRKCNLASGSVRHILLGVGFSMSNVYFDTGFPMHRQTINVLFKYSI